MDERHVENAHIDPASGLEAANQAYASVQAWLEKTRASWCLRAPLKDELPGLGDAWLSGTIFSQQAIVPWRLSSEALSVSPADLLRVLDAGARKAYPRHQKLIVQVILIYDSRVGPVPAPGAFDVKATRKSLIGVVCSGFDVAQGKFTFKSKEQYENHDELLPILTLAKGKYPELTDFGPAVNLVRQKPVAIYGLMALILAVAVAQFVFRVDSTSALQMSVPDLIAMGGNLPPRTRAGEYWRLATATLLHGGVLHVMLNLLCIWIAGRSLERLIGGLWSLAVFAATGLAASVASYAFGSDNMVAIGASGGALGLVGTGLVVATRLRAWTGRGLLQLQFLQILIPSLIMLRSPDGSMVDLAAHLGGALAGILLGIILLLPPIWPAALIMPRAKFLAASVVAAFVGLAGWGGFTVISGWSEEITNIQSALQLRERQQVWIDRLMPDSRRPQAGQSWDAVAQAFPEDPRVLLVTSEQLYLQGQPHQAIARLEPVWRDIDAVRPLYTDAVVGDSVALNMALYYTAAGRFSDADAPVAVACATTNAQLLAIANDNGLCNPRRRYWQANLIPDLRLPQAGANWDAVTAEFPNDPRVLIRTSEALYQQGAAADAIAQLEPVWMDRETIREIFTNPAFVDAVALNMALYYAQASRHTEADAAAAVACASTDGQVVALANQNGICAPSP